MFGVVFLFRPFFGFCIVGGDLDGCWTEIKEETAIEGDARRRFGKDQRRFGDEDARRRRRRRLEEILGMIRLRRD
ncbi:unnamed protein product [Cochlearia groenlandica]